jgi:hypothetical protein
MKNTKEKTPEIRESVQIPVVKQAGGDITKEEQNRKDENRKELGYRKLSASKCNKNFSENKMQPKSLKREFYSLHPIDYSSIHSVFFPSIPLLLLLSKTT